MEAEMAANLAAEYEKGRERLSESLRDQLARGRACSALDYQVALARIAQVAEGLGELFHRYDALLTPSAAGTAPKGLESTGDPVFCTIWTFCGLPALNLPLMRGAGGLPLGMQLVGPRHGDGRLLRTARWLVNSVGSQQP
jgi:Asp-tRNA(Asn)/Glu-tRNA(Gln) amidotransferase A subunit family amidase